MEAPSGTHESALRARHYLEPAAGNLRDTSGGIPPATVDTTTWSPPQETYATPLGEFRQLLLDTTNSVACVAIRRREVSLRVLCCCT